MTTTMTLMCPENRKPPFKSGYVCDDAWRALSVVCDVGERDADSKAVAMMIKGRQKALSPVKDFCLF